MPHLVRNDKTKPLQEDARLRPLSKVFFVQKIMYKMLSPRDVEEAKRHVYFCENHSLVDRFILPFSKYILKRVPSVICPNVLTFFGLFFSWSAFAIAATFIDTNDSFHKTLIISLCMIVYQILDGVDGKLARQTNNSTCLGEVLDHVRMMPDHCSVYPFSSYLTHFFRVVIQHPLLPSFWQWR